MPNNDGDARAQKIASVPAFEPPLENPWSSKVTTKTVIFRRPFIVDAADGEQPPGIYTVETEEELLDSAPFPVFRRLSTVIRCPAAGGIVRFVTIDPAALDAALMRDARTA